MLDIFGRSRDGGSIDYDSEVSKEKIDFDKIISYVENYALECVIKRSDCL